MPPASERARRPGPKVVTVAVPCSVTETTCTGPRAIVERAAAGLCRHCRRGHECVRNEPDGDRAEQECLQRPHATLPSPPSTVRARACPTRGQPASARVGSAANADAVTQPTPTIATASGPPTATRERRRGGSAAWRTDVRRPRVTRALGTPLSRAACAASWSPSPAPVATPTARGTAIPDASVTRTSWAVTAAVTSATIAARGRMEARHVATARGTVPVSILRRRTRVAGTAPAGASRAAS